MDALAAALDRLPRRPVTGCVAVAMSGGVDSAVALLRAGPDAIGVTLRLWLDPEGPDTERACCSPEAVVRPARPVMPGNPACHPRCTRGVPPRGRRAVRPRLCARRDAEPVHALQRRLPLRAAPRVRRSAGAARLATGHYARIVEPRGRLLLARAADPAKDQSYMLARLDPAPLDRIWFPLGEQTKDEPAPRPRAPGSPRRARRESQEAASSPAATTASSSPATVSPPRTARRGRGRPRAGRHAGFWRFTPGQRRGLGVPRAPAVRARLEPATNTLVVGPRAALARSRVSARGRLLVLRRRVDAKLRYRSSPAPRAPGRGRPRAASGRQFDEPAYSAVPGQTAVLNQGRRDRRLGPDRVAHVRSAPMLSSPITASDAWQIALSVFLVVIRRSPSRGLSSALAGTLKGPHRVPRRDAGGGPAR